MSLTLNVGVFDIPHVGGEKTGLTTGDLAEILESKYGLYSGFVELHGQEIADVLADGVQDALDAIIGAGVNAVDPLGAAELPLTAMLIRYFDNEEIAKLGVPGVPTGAALKGINRRKASGKGVRRTSFIDTSELRNSSSVWVEGS